MQDELSDEAFELLLKCEKEEVDMDEIAHSVKLMPHQKEHVDRLNAMLDIRPFALDFSMLGSGKTFTSTHLALTRKFKHVIVVCPVSVIPKWRKMKTQFRLPMNHLLGYQSLRSTKFHQPKHGLLHRRDFTQTQQHQSFWRPNEFISVDIEKMEFSPTDTFKQMVEEGVLLIFDEIQNIKNISSQFHAAQALIQAITLRHGPLLQSCGRKDTFKSHVLLLSGSPIDKHEQAVHVFRALGIMTEDRIAQHNIQTGVTGWTGMQEILNFCGALSKPLTASVSPKHIWESLDMFAFRLFVSVFKPTCASSMPPPSVDTKLRKRNAFYTIDAQGADIIRRGLGQLSTAARWDGQGVHFEGGQGAAALSGVTRSLQVIETGKIQLFARIARQELNANPKLKVVIAVNFTDTLTDLVEALKEFDPLILNGSTSEIARGVLIDEFQKPDTNRRLLVCNQSVASTGIDLDDKHGEFPRLALVSPNYATITSYQLGHRFQRMDSKSDARVHFVFAKHAGRSVAQSSDIVELSVLDALSRKSKVLQETVSEQSKAGIVFPGDHAVWSE